MNLMKLSKPNIPEFSDENYRKASYIVTAIVGLSGLFLIIEMFTNADLRIHAQWNMFKSWLLGPLYIVGLVMAFLHFGDNHYSYDYYEQEYDSHGNKIGKPKKSYDVIDTMEGNCLVPLMMHLVVEPLIWAALIYYPLMCVVAILGALVPYILAIVIVGLCYLVFKFPSKCNFRYHSAALVTLGVVLTAIFGISGLSIQNMASEKTTPSPSQSEFVEENTEDSPIDNADKGVDDTTEVGAEVGSGDLSLFELRSNVKSCEWKYGQSGETVNCGFDEKGICTTYKSSLMGDVAFSDVERDNSSRMTKYTQGTNGIADNYSIVYDDAGRVTVRNLEMGEGVEVTSYDYNGQGFVSKEQIITRITEMGADEPDEQQVIFEYTYDNVDDHGNWTKRTYKLADGTTVSDTRVITYY